MATVEAVQIGDSDLPAVNLPDDITVGSGNFVGTYGLPGASGNANPGSIVSSVPFGPENPLDPSEQFLNTATQGLSSNSLINNIHQLLANIGAMESGTPTGPTALNNNPSNSTNSISPTGISDIFLRAVIIILGFIFVAVGLSMFKSGDIRLNIDPLKGFKKLK